MTSGGGTHRPEPEEGVYAPTTRARALGIVLLCAIVAIVVVLTLRPGDSKSKAAAGSSTPASSSPAPATTAPSTHAPASSPAPSAATSAAPTQTVAAAHAAITKVVGEVPDGAAGVAAMDMTTGKTVTAGSTEPNWTASMYKLLVLETLLRENGPLDGGQLSQATTMIEQSDNVAGYDLWEAGGSNSGLTKTLDDLKMTHSEADGTDPTFTRLTPADALKMVKALVTKNDVISPAAQQQALGLMRNVESDQRWGVGVVADKGTDFANKNGWLGIDDDNGPGEDDGGRWVVTSVGVVTVHGHQVLLASMSEHNASMGDGIDVIQSLSKSAVTLLGL